MLPEFLEYGFMQRAFAVGIVTALVCPAIGVFLIPRRLSLIADVNPRPRRGASRRCAWGPRWSAGALALAALFAALALAGPAVAHPHVFVDHSITVIVGQDGLEGLQFAWAFDEMFSSMLVLTFDTDKDKRFSASEVKAAEQRHFAHLKEFNFFVQLRVNDKPVTVTAFKDFQVTLVKGQVIYAFTVPVKAAEGTLEVAVEDPTYYSAFAIRSPIHIQSAKHYRVDCRVARDGGIIAEVVKCAFKRQAQ